ncbi:MAG: phosphomannomutase [Sinimarinibacterium sp.]|jgi:phosphomannomutase
MNNLTHTASAPRPALRCFKAYDIRGRVPDEIDPSFAYLLGVAYTERFAPHRVALGRDVRHSSPALLDALALAFNDCGVEVLDLGLCGTEELYWAAMQPGVDGGIAITASHNPIDYNGMKLVRAGAVPVSGDSGLRDLEALVADSAACLPRASPRKQATSFRDAYVHHVLGFIDRSRLRPLRIVVNCGNGAVGPLLDALEPRLPFELIRVHAQPDGSFPHGIPNPLLPEMRADTVAAVRAYSADFGVAWDGDFDRCFLFDERGSFIEGYYIVGLLAQMLLQKCGPGERKPRIVHDPRLVWNTVDIVTQNGGDPVQSKTGHAYIKERMRAEDAIYGGEMSAHHYFREFAYCDNGTLPWLLIAELICESDTPLSQLVGDRMRRFPVSGEINRRVDDIAAILARVEKRYGAQALSLDCTDGLGLEFDTWRFNVRGSNTEPLLRLNVEARGDRELMLARTSELLALIDRTQ